MECIQPQWQVCHVVRQFKVVVAGQVSDTLQVERVVERQDGAFDGEWYDASVISTPLAFSTAPENSTDAELPDFACWCKCLS